MTDNIICNLALAISLILSDHPVEHSDLQMMAPYLKSGGIALHLIDPTESTYWFHSGVNLRLELDNLRKREREVRSAPHQDEAKGFGLSFDDVSKLVQNNISYRDYLNSQLKVASKEEIMDEINSTIRENEVQLNKLLNLQRALAPYSYIFTKRIALAGLREQMGAPAYYRFESIPCIPIWRLPRSK